MLLTAACCFQVLTGLAVCIRSGNNGRCQCCCCCFYCACIVVTTLIAAVASAVASLAVVAVPYAAAAAVASFAQGLASMFLVVYSNLHVLLLPVTL